ncbi:MAG: 3-deoxy-D-manno-octulosonic acid transferase [Paracoccaceae bacterium]
MRFPRRAPTRCRRHADVMPRPFSASRHSSRLGRCPLEVAALTRPTIWIHTGATPPGATARTLAQRLGEEEFSFVFSSVSATSTAPLPGPVVPLEDDRHAPVRAFLDTWRPAVGIWTECDLRANLLAEASSRKTLLFMAESRGTRPDHRPWRWRPRLQRTMLSRFSRILAANAVNAAEFRRMGADPQRLELSGFLEESGIALPCDMAEHDALAECIAARPAWLAVGIADEAELSATVAAHRRALQHAHRLLLILSPATPAEAPAIAERLREEGWSVARRAAGQDPERETQIYLADVPDELGLWYRLAPISFLGQSLEKGPGLDPFEPAALGSAILHGPNVQGYRDAYGRLAAAGACRLVRSARELGTGLERVLSPDIAASMAQEAWRVVSAGAEVTDRLVRLVRDALEEAPRK